MALSFHSNQEEIDLSQYPLTQTAERIPAPGARANIRLGGGRQGSRSVLLILASPNTKICGHSLLLLDSNHLRERDRFAY